MHPVQEPPPEQLLFKFRNSVAIVLIMVPPSLLIIIIKIIARVRIIAMETNESENESMTVDDHAEAGIDSASSGRVRPFSDATVAALRAYHKKGMVGIGRNYSGVIEMAASETGLSVEQVKVSVYETR